MRSDAAAWRVLDLLPRHLVLTGPIVATELAIPLKSANAALGELVAADLARVGLPLARPPVAAFSRRLTHAYPIFRRGYETALDRVEAWLESLPALVSYGRQGAFAHDNTHHALAMAYAAVDCLRDGEFDRARWAGHREEFARHVVED